MIPVIILINMNTATTPKVDERSNDIDFSDNLLKVGRRNSTIAKAKIMAINVMKISIKFYKLTLKNHSFIQ